jgi:hypothetical protein
MTSFHGPSPDVSTSVTVFTASITIRSAYADDEAALLRLAALDSARVPEMPLLIAEVNGEPKVALSLRDGAAIADPFVPTRHLLDLLKLYAGAVVDGARARAPAAQRRRQRRFARWTHGSAPTFPRRAGLDVGVGPPPGPRVHWSGDARDRDRWRPMGR